MAEIELKLEIAPADIKAVVASGRFGKPSESIAQHAVYFDTDERRLFGSGFTLRIRQTGEARTQTVKAVGAGASIFARSEWETPVTANVPVLDQTNPLLSKLGEIVDDVAPQFEVEIERRIWRLTENASHIECAVDQGIVTAGERQTSICEIELELKGGHPADIFILARKIEAAVPIKFGVQSKAERGYRLLEEMRTLIKAEPIDLDRTADAAKGFQTLAQSCFRQFRLNEAILLRKGNPDALHQARIGLRRLRSAFSLFKPVLDEEAQRLSSEFRWLAGVLGEVRNLDVLLQKTERGEFRDLLQEKRDDAYTDVVNALGSSRARALMLDFNEWLHCGNYIGNGGDAVPVGAFAAKALEKMRRRMKKHGRDLAAVDDEQRHQVRKDAKKLRYGAEFFASLYLDKRERRRLEGFIKAMASLQDQLGALNDLVTGPGVLDKHGLLDHPDAKDVVLHRNKDKLIDDAQTALDDVLDAKRFWQ